MKTLELIKCAAIAAITAVISAGSVSAAPITNSTGLSAPQNTVTFEEIALPIDTPMTSQYVGLGVTFSGLFYDGIGPNTGDGFPNMSGHALANFDGNTCPCSVPFSIGFVTPVTSAAFALISTSGLTLFEAILANGAPIESFTVTTDLSSATNFYGFQGILFDQIRVTRLNTVSTVVDNIQFNSVATPGPTTGIPEPTALALFGFGLAGLGYMRRRRAV